jgi:hypothetical protein
MSESLDLLRQAVSLEPLDRLDDPPVDCAPGIVEKTAICHFLRQRVLERVLRFREHACLVQELR